VLLSAGGFSHNREMVAYHAPKYKLADPLGSIGCNGSGIRLGQSVGGSVDKMNNISAWLNINPPEAFAQGIIVNGLGERFVSEDCYGAKIGYHVVEENDGKAFIILDRTLYSQALRQALPGSEKLFRNQCAPALLSLIFGATRANTLEALAKKCKMRPELLTASVEEYNRSATGKEMPRFEKHSDYLTVISKPSFYALDISITSNTFYFPSISLGGLVINEKTGQVIGTDGNAIPRLYAAGRNAIGVASNNYVSGLSISDCVFSGRRAGRHGSEQ
jgi:3-oxo-5alpha-steroid 4-dehydrogenase